MNLREAVATLSTLDPEMTIYASRPWAPDSEVFIAQEPDDGGVPPDAAKQGMFYFLEVSIAQEFVEDWCLSQGGTPSTDQKCARLVDYARDDA